MGVSRASRRSVVLAAPIRADGIAQEKCHTARSHSLQLRKPTNNPRDRLCRALPPHAATLRVFPLRGGASWAAGRRNSASGGPLSSDTDILLPPLRSPGPAGSRGGEVRLPRSHRQPSRPPRLPRAFLRASHASLPRCHVASRPRAAPSRLSPAPTPPAAPDPPPSPAHPPSAARSYGFFASGDGDVEEEELGGELEDEPDVRPSRLSLLLLFSHTSPRPPPPARLEPLCASQQLPQRRFSAVLSANQTVFKRVAPPRTPAPPYRAAPEGDARERRARGGG